MSGKLTAHNCVVLLVDLQQKLLPAMHNQAALLAASVRLAAGATLLGVLVVVTEQYPRGLGATAPEVLAALPQPEVFVKTRFSAAIEAVLASLRRRGASRVILAGIETHVCIQQTALDLLDRGFAVHLCVDAAGSRRVLDHDTAIARLRHAGVQITTTESVLFELLGDAADPRFKALLAIVK